MTLFKFAFYLHIINTRITLFLYYFVQCIATIPIYSRDVGESTEGTIEIYSQILVTTSSDEAPSQLTSLVAIRDAKMVKKKVNVASCTRT